MVIITLLGGTYLHRIAVWCQLCKTNNIWEINSRLVIIFRFHELARFQIFCHTPTTKKICFSGNAHCYCHLYENVNMHDLTVVTSYTKDGLSFFSLQRVAGFFPQQVLPNCMQIFPSCEVSYPICLFWNWKKKFIIILDILWLNCSHFHLIITTTVMHTFVIKENLFFTVEINTVGPILHILTLLQ